MVAEHVALYEGARAWVVGEHDLPRDLPRRSVASYRRGDVIVHSNGRWTVMSRDRFEREYEWVDGN
jgi:hypothetical protein